MRAHAPALQDDARTLTSVSALLATVGLPKSRFRRERRLRPRLAALAFNGVEERRLLAADVRATTAPDLDVEALARSHDVVTRAARRPARAAMASRIRASPSGYSPRM